MEHAFLFGGKIMYEKKKIRIQRLIWFVLLIVTAGISIAFWTSWFDEILSIGLTIFICLIDCTIPVLFIGSLLLSCKAYDYNGKEIIVYAGWYHHYIKVDGVMVDEHNTITSFTPIVMSATLESSTELRATISLTNRISLKINNQLYLKEK